MFKEAPGGNESPSVTPNGQDQTAGEPTYPRPGQAETIAAIRAQEASESSNPEAILAELESQESPEERNSRLKKFVAEHFADVCPPEYRDAAVERCLVFEDGCRELFDEPDLELTEDDAADPELRQKIEVEAAKKAVTVASNDKEIAAKREKIEPKNQDVAKNDQRIAEGATAVAKEKSKTQILEKHAIDRETAEAEVDSDLSTIKQVQARFEQLKAEKGGTIPALRSLLEDDVLKSPEMKAKVRSAVATAEALVNAVPGKSEVVTRILNQSNINLAAANPIQIFVGFLAKADKSNELTDDEKAQIRRVIGQSEKDFQTGTDAVKIAKSKEQIIDPETGEVIGEKYVHDSRDNMAELRPNLGTYMDGERMKLATKDGSVERDVTGWSPEDIGLLAEVLEFHSFAEGSGITGMVESIGNIRFNVIGDTAFDRSKVLEIRQVISALVGAGEGYDGDVFDPRQKGLLLKAQMRVLTDNDQSIEWNNDESGTTKIIESLGLKKDGQPNFDVMKAFGSYVQENMNATRKTVQAHLHSLFPDLIAPPDDDDQTPHKDK